MGIWILMLEFKGLTLKLRSWVTKFWNFKQEKCHKTEGNIKITAQDIKRRYKSHNKIQQEARLVTEHEEVWNALQLWFLENYFLVACSILICHFGGPFKYNDVTCFAGGGGRGGLLNKNLSIAQCKVIQDSRLEFRITRCGFPTPSTGFRISIVSRIPDSLSWVPGFQTPELLI